MPEQGTLRGIAVRGAKYETAAAYAHQAFVKPTIANWGDAELSDYAVGFAPMLVPQIGGTFYIPLGGDADPPVRAELSASILFRVHT